MPEGNWGHSLLLRGVVGIKRGVEWRRGGSLGEVEAMAPKYADISCLRVVFEAGYGWLYREGHGVRAYSSREPGTRPDPSTLRHTPAHKAGRT